ncbi:MAG: GAF domain-containing sensor histidine kinase [Pelobium sp.]
MDFTAQEYKEKMDEIYKLTSLFLDNDENTLTNVLSSACTFLGFETGIICHIENGKYHVLDFYSTLDRESLKGKTLDLTKTFCEATIKENKLLAVSNIADSKYKTHITHTLNNLQSYIGIPIHFSDHEIGTLNFSSSQAKAEHFKRAETDLLEYLGQWVNHYLDKQYYKNKLDSKTSELESLNKKLEKKNRSLNDLMKEKNELIQILVHDLKSPLSNIKMLSYLFQEFSTDTDSEELVSIFNKSLGDVFHLIEQMEILNSVENFPINNYIEEFDLQKFLKENIKNFNNVAESKSIKLNFNCNEESAMIKTDKNFLNRILNNLISNALKFSYFDKSITINLLKKDNQFIISVQDEGPGLSLEDQKKLFGKFSKLTSKPTNNESSSGLGLFIVNELVKNLKGSIKVESTLNEGSTFSVILPAQLNKKESLIHAF